jgi:SOS-response transcriptional repressor LexA
MPTDYREIGRKILNKLEIDPTRQGEALSMVSEVTRGCLENEAWNEVPTYCELARELCDELWINGIDPAHAEGVSYAYEGVSYLYQADKKAERPEESAELAKAIDCLKKSQQSFSEYRDHWNEIIIGLNLGRLYRSQNKLNDALLAFERSRTFSNLDGLSSERIEEIVTVVSTEIEETRRLFGDGELFAPHAPEKLLPPMQPKVAPLRVLPIIDEIAAGTEKPVSDDDFIGYIQQIDESEFMFEGQALEVQLLGKSRVTFSPAYDYVAVQVSGDSMDEAGISPNDYVILQKEKAGVLPLQPYPGNIVAVVFRDEDDKATLKRFYFDWSSGSVTLKPESSNPEHKPRVLRPEVFAGDNPSVAIVGIVMAVLKPQPVLKPRPRIEVQQRRFTDIRFPEQCRINQPVHLSIQLTVDSMTRGGREGQAELIVFVSADSFEIDRRWQKLSVPFGQDSEKVEFELVGQKLGTQIIEIEFFHGTARVGYIVVETRVVDGYTSGQDRQAVMENPCVAIDDRAFPTSTQQQPDVGIRVHWRKGEEIEYSIQRGWWQQVDFSMSLAQCEEQVVALWKDVSAELGKAVRPSGLHQNELHSVQLRVKGLGRRLCGYLVPAELQSLSSTWPVGSIVSISTNEHWIPWELIHDRDDFWGNKFILARLPRLPDPSFFSASDGTVKQNASTQLRKVVNVIGGGLKPPIVERVRKLFTAFGPDIPVEPPVERATLAEVLRSIADADIIHFTCHGHTAPWPCLQIADDRSPTPCLTPSDLENLLELTGSVIFANACASAVVTSFLGELCNFGWEFCKKGAVAYIGTLGLVPTEYAITFAERFYERLLNGYTVGESLHYAKSKAERENPFWLLYTIYGRPFARKHIQP